MHIVSNILVFHSSFNSCHIGLNYIKKQQHKCITSSVFFKVCLKSIDRNKKEMHDDAIDAFPVSRKFGLDVIQIWILIVVLLLFGSNCLLSHRLIYFSFFDFLFFCARIECVIELILRLRGKWIVWVLLALRLCLALLIKSLHTSLVDNFINVKRWAKLRTVEFWLWKEAYYLSPS